MDEFHDDNQENIPPVDGTYQEDNYDVTVNDIDVGP